MGLLASFLRHNEILVEIENRKFFVYLSLFGAPFGVTASEIHSRISCEKTRMIGLPGNEKFDVKFGRLDTLHQRDGRTGMTDTARQQRLRYA